MPRQAYNTITPPQPVTMEDARRVAHMNASQLLVLTGNTTLTHEAVIWLDGVGTGLFETSLYFTYGCGFYTQLCGLVMGLNALLQKIEGEYAIPELVRLGVQEEYQLNDHRPWYSKYGFNLHANISRLTVWGGSAALATTAAGYSPAGIAAAGAGAGFGCALLGDCLTGSTANKISSEDAIMALHESNRQPGFHND